MKGVELYSHQEEAVRKLKNGNILCGGVGSGKSRTSLAYYYIQQGLSLSEPGKLNAGSKPRDLYIITTARKRDTLEWEQEMLPFLMSTHEENNALENRIVVDSWNNIKKYQDVYGAFFIFDEQRVIGSGAWVKAFLKITRKNQWILLSATPGDTWTDYIPVFIANGFYKNRSDFTQRHVVWKRVHNFYKVDRYLDIGILTKHARDILVNMKYQKPAHSNDIELYSVYDRLAYKEVIRSRWNPFDNTPIENASAFCYTLRRLVNSDPSRIEIVKQIVAEKERVIIFYNFDYELEILKNTNYGRGVKVAAYNGHEHQSIPKSKRWVYLVQYTAGAEGWNCIYTDTIIFYSQNYSYRITTQASGRIDRLNTPYKELYYYHIKSRSSIDIAISHALSQKKDFNIANFKG